MAIVKKQFSTFSVSYVDTEINSDNFWEYGVDVENENYGAHIRGGEFNYDIALQIRSDNEQQVREAIAEVINHRRFWLSQLESLLK